MTPSLRGQVSGLVRKNFTIFRRNPKTVAVNVLYPFYMIGVLVVLSYTIGQTYDYGSVHFHSCHLPTLCNSFAGNIGFVCPSDSPDHDGCIAWMQETDTALRMLEESQPEPYICPIVTLAANEAALETSYNAGLTYAGVVVTAASATEVAYKLRLDGGDPSSSTCSDTLNCAMSRWPREKSITDLSLQESFGGDRPTSSHSASWWLAATNSDGRENIYTLSTAALLNSAAGVSLQGIPRAANFSVSTESCASGAGSASALSAGGEPQFQQYPIAKTESSGVYNTWSSFGTLIPFYVVMAFSYLSKWTCLKVKQEQELKQLESMRMMGLTEKANILGWACTMLPFALVCGIGGSLLLTATPVLPGANFLLVFALISLFILSFVPMAVLISLAVKEARSAESLGQLLPIIFGALNFVLVGETRPGIKYAVSLIPTVALEVGMNAMIEFVRKGKEFGFGRIHDDSGTGISYVGALGMLVFDLVWMSVLAWYLRLVLPGEYGVGKNPFFLCSNSASAAPLHGGGGGGGLREALIDEEEEHNLTSVGPTADLSLFEPLVAPPTGGQKVRVRRLVKEFSGGEDGRVGLAVRAVDDLSFDMYENQIFCLLGHNGAGKSTAIGILTGLFDATSGYVEALGLRVAGEGGLGGLDKVRTQLGVCPQHDVLWDELTVVEHLCLYGRIKGIDSREIEAQVADVVSAVGLEEKETELAAKLSGGMKRRLSVGIALMGDPRIIVLDEPTAGLDPTSRRQIWELLQERKKGRIVMLTTHFMDEADVLGDRIAIMSKGKLECSGTSLFLKEKFGIGYHLDVVPSSPPDEFKSSHVDSAVMKHVPEASVSRSEGVERSYTLPASSRKTFGDLFDELDSRSPELGISTYGVSLTTLEEVFIKVTTDAEKRDKQAAGDATDTDDAAAVASNHLRLSFSDNHAAVPPSDLHQFYVLTSTNVRQLRRNKKALFCIVVIPVIFSMVSLLVYKYAGGNSSSSSLSKVPSATFSASPPTIFSGSSLLFSTPLSSSSSSGGGSESPPPCFSSLEADYDTTYVKGSLSRFVNDTTTSSIAGVSFGGSSICADGLFNGTIDILFSGNSPNAVAQVMMSTAVGSSLKSGTQVSVTIEPFAFDGDTAVDYDAATVSIGYVMGTLMSIFVSFPASIVVGMKESGVDLQLKLVGVSSLVRWGSIVAMMFVMFLVVLTPFVLLVLGLQVEPFSTAVGFGALVAILLVAVAQTVATSLLLSMLFKTRKSSDETISGVIVAPTLILYAILWQTLPLISVDGQNPAGVGFNPSTWLPFSLLSFPFSMFLPPLTVMGGLATLNMQSVFGSQPLVASKVWSWSVDYSGYSCDDGCVQPGVLSVLAPSLCATGILTFILLNDTSGLCRRHAENKATAAAAVAVAAVAEEDAEEEEEDQEDPAVERERLRVESLRHEDHNHHIRPVVQGERMRMDDLRKEYPGGTVAVQQVSVGLQDGEVFGLLGPNGAGKTSLVSMLTGDLVPTAGNAWVGGHSIITDLNPVMSDTGFCPQFGGLFEYNTVQEELALYCELRGMTLTQQDSVVALILDALDLKEHAFKLTSQLSGGNKRKLSAALTLLGSPRTIYLDEPSTGVDAKARRKLWDLIDANKTGRVTLLITHSMEEADALSSRIGIMVKGKLRALGTPQELKSTHGSGYVLQLRTSNPQATLVAIPELFPGAVLLEDHAGAQRFALPSATKVGTAFRVLDANVNNSSTNSNTSSGTSSSTSRGINGGDGGAAGAAVRTGGCIGGVVDGSSGVGGVGGGAIINGGGGSGGGDLGIMTYALSQVTLEQILLDLIKRHSPPPKVQEDLQ